jgi:hypothetical protein
MKLKITEQKSNRLDGIFSRTVDSSEKPKKMLANKSKVENH